MLMGYFERVLHVHWKRLMIIKQKYTLNQKTGGFSDAACHKLCRTESILSLNKILQSTCGILSQSISQTITQLVNSFMTKAVII